MNNDFNKKDVVKKKNRQSSTYELELYFKNNIKNNKNNKNNKRKNKDNRVNNPKITKIIVNDEVINETSIEKPNEPLVEEITLVKKKKVFVLDKKNKKKQKNDNKIDNKNVDDNILIKKKKFSIFRFGKKKKTNDKKRCNKNEVKNKKIKDFKINNALNVDNNEEKINAEKTLKEISRDIKKSKRKKYFKEALVFTGIVLLINVIIYFTTDYISMLRLFDVEYLNIIITIIIMLVLVFISSFLFDYLISELLNKFKNRKIRNREESKDKKVKAINKHGGDLYRNPRVKQEKHRENRKVKK